MKRIRGSPIVRFYLKPIVEPEAGETRPSIHRLVDQEDRGNFEAQDLPHEIAGVLQMVSKKLADKGSIEVWLFNRSRLFKIERLVIPMHESIPESWEERVREELLKIDAASGKWSLTARGVVSDIWPDPFILFHLNPATTPTAGMEELPEEFLEYEKTLAAEVNRGEFLQVELDESGFIQQLFFQNGRKLYNPEAVVSGLSQKMRIVLLAYDFRSVLLLDTRLGAFERLSNRKTSLGLFRPETQASEERTGWNVPEKIQKLLSLVAEGGGVHEFALKPATQPGKDAPVGASGTVMLELANSPQPVRILVSKSGWTISHLPPAAGMEEPILWQKGVKELAEPRLIASFITSLPEVSGSDIFNRENFSASKMLEVLKRRIQGADAIGFLPFGEDDASPNPGEVRWVSLDSLHQLPDGERLEVAAFQAQKELLYTWLAQNRAPTHISLRQTHYNRFQRGSKNHCLLGRVPS